MASNLVKEKEMQGITNKSNKTYVILSFEQLSQEVDTVAPTKNVNGVYIYIYHVGTESQKEVSADLRLGWHRFLFHFLFHLRLGSCTKVLSCMNVAKMKALGEKQIGCLVSLHVLLP